MTSNLIRHRIGRALAAGLAAALVLSACSSGSDDAATSSDATAAADSTSSTPEIAASDDATSESTAGDDTPIFSESEFAPVCRGTGVAKATAFDPAAAIRPLRLPSGEDPDYAFSSVQLPDGWQTQFESFETTQLVACLDRVTATAVELCEGYEDEESGVTWSVQTHDTSWEVTLREATTAEVVAEASFEVPTSGCPMFSFFTEGDPNPVLDYTEPSADLEVFLKPHVDGV